MKTNSSKNRKSNIPTTSNNTSKMIDGVHKTTNSSQNNTTDINIKIDESSISDFFNKEVKNLGDVFKNNLDLTQQLIAKEMNLYRDKNKKIYDKYENTIKSLKLSKFDNSKLLEAKKNSMLQDTQKYYDSLLQKYGLTVDDKNKKESSKDNPIIQKLDEIGENFKNTVEKTLDRNKDALKGALFGSLNLITAPLEEFFGFDTMDLFKKALGLGDKKTKKKPTTSDVQKKGDDGALLLNNTINELFGKKVKKKDDKVGVLEKLSKGIKGITAPLLGFVKNIPILGTALKGFGLLGKSFGKNVLGKGGNISKFLASGATKTALKAISPMAIITSIIMMVVDGIKGIFKAKEWGVPKGSAFLGGLFGGVEKGAKGAFKNMGKWALMGFGVGCIFTPIGGIVGGIIGAIFGAVLGAIGGERLSKLFTEFGNWVLKPFKEIGNIWKNEEGTIMQKIGKTLGKVIQGIITLPFKFYILAFKKIKNWFMSKKEMKKQEKEMKKKVKPNKNKSPITEFFKGFWDGATKSIKEFFSNPLLFSVKGALAWTDKIMGWIWDGVAGLIQGIFGVETISWKDFKTNISDTLQKYVLDPMFRMFGVCKDFFDMLFHKPSLIWKAITQSDYDLGNAFEDFTKLKESKVENVNDAIIKKDGTIIRTSEDDNLIATKNDPTKITSMKDFNSERLKDVMNSNKNITQIDYTNQFDKMIGLLEKLLNKEIVVNTDNTQSLSDLRVLAGGYNVSY